MRRMAPFVFLLSTTAVSWAGGQDLLHLIGSPDAPDGDRFGSTLALLKDLDGDGISELAIGAPGDGTDRTGAVFLYSTRDANLVDALFGDTPFEGFSESLASVSDTNGDGTVDLLVGSPFDWGLAWGTGSAHLFSGKDRALRFSFELAHEEDDHFGRRVCGLPDVNGDGHGDLLISATDLDVSGLKNSGRAWLISGFDGAILAVHDGETIGDHFGLTLAPFVDIDADARPDYLIGSPFTYDGLDSIGSLTLYSSSTHTPIWTKRGLVPFGDFGTSAATIPDRDGDSIDDLLVGAPGESRVYFLSGATGAVLDSRKATYPTYRYGERVVNVGDANGDRVDDYVIGDSSSSPNGQGYASAHLVSGRTGNLLYTFTAPALYDGFGNSISPCGDVDEDGLADLAFGIPYSETFGVSGGAVEIRRGNDLFLDASPRRIGQGDRVLCRLGEGETGTRAMLVVVEVDGQPRLTQVWSGAFPSSLTIELQFEILQGLGPHTYTLLAVAEDPGTPTLRQSARLTLEVR